jgi:predicted nuclease of restriction endonuclease-like (RecB) superfamily
MQQTIEHGWSREVMAEQIERKLHARQGKLQSNFELTLPPATSDMAAQLFKDPRVFPFPGSWTSPIASEYRT